MDSSFRLLRTTTSEPDFRRLVQQLDHKLWNELNEDQATYDPFNNVQGLSTAILVYAGQEPVACGCFKSLDAKTVEIKRMFVKKPYRGQGLSKLVLSALENWALEEGYREAVLETSVHFETARGLYRSTGYQVIPNYPPYEELPESVCMKKILVRGNAASEK